MTASELKYNVDKTGSSFFTRNNMKFFGDTIANYGVRQSNIDSWTENNIDVWELYRKRPARRGINSTTYFRKDNFKIAFKKKEVIK